MAQASRVKPGTPTAVSKAARRAEEMHKEIYGSREDDTQEAAGAEAQDAQGESTGDTIQPVEPAAQPDAAKDTSAPPPEAPLNGATPPANAQEAPEPAPQPAPPAEDWEQKYKALQGKYNAEVPRMAADIRALREELQALKSAPPPKPAEPEPKKPVVTDQDIVDYGEDLIDLIRRVSRGEVGPVVEQLKPEIEQVKGQVTQAARQQATTSVYSVLDRDVQDWRTINKSSEFLEWLNQSDPYVGDIRKNLLSDAFQKGDANRVAAFFKGFLAERQVVSPPPQQQPAASAPASVPAPQVSLEQLAGPAGAPSAAAQGVTPTPAPSWTRAQVAKFYSDVAAGVFNKDPARKAQIENSIAAAMREGRIT